MKVSESDFMAALEQHFNRAESPIRVQRINSGDLSVQTRGKVRRIRGAAPGTGDLVGWVVGEGWHVEIEVKSATGRQSDVQRAREAVLVKQGAIYVLVKYRAEKSFAENVDRAAAEVDAAIHHRRHGDRWADRPEGCTVCPTCGAGGAA